MMMIKMFDNDVFMMISVIVDDDLDDSNALYDDDDDYSKDGHSYISCQCDLSTWVG